jgi:hypothetical protein
MLTAVAQLATIEMKLRYIFRRYRSGSEKERSEFLEKLRGRVGPSLYHSRQPTTTRTEAAPSSYPTKFDEKERLNLEKLLTSTVSSGHYLHYLKPCAYDWASGQEKLLKDRHYDFLSRITRPCVPNLVQLIVAYVQHASMHVAMIITNYSLVR